MPLAGWLAFRAAVAWWPYPASVAQDPPRSTCLEDRNGLPLAALVASDGQWRIPVADDEISPHLLNAIVAVEDARFESHGGVDWRSAAAAAWQDVSHLSLRRGASTLTMQLQRLRDPRPHTLLNKLEQAIRAEQIERARTKRQILVEYVNRAPFGGNLVGAGAASWRYFGHPCRQLSLGEAALLAGLPQSPNRLRPDRHPARAKARRDHVLDRMLACGFVTRTQRDEAAAEPIAAAWRPLPQDRRAGGLPPADGALAAMVRLAQDRPGRVVRSTLDAAVQRQAAAAARERLEAMAGSGISAVAVVVLDTRTAECLATVSLQRPSVSAGLSPAPRTAGEGNGCCTAALGCGPPAWHRLPACAGFARGGTAGRMPVPHEAQPRAAVLQESPPGAAVPHAPVPVSPAVANPSLDLARRRRSTGSTLKPFIYAAAFDAGLYGPRSVLSDTPAAWPGYEPNDFDRTFRGNLTAAEALAESRNIPAMVVLSKVGIDNAIGVMDAAGLHGLARSPERYGLSLAIGGAEASPMEIAQAYAMLGRGGVPRAIRTTLEPESCGTAALGCDGAPRHRHPACGDALRATDPQAGSLCHAGGTQPGAAVPQEPPPFLSPGVPGEGSERPLPGSSRTSPRVLRASACWAVLNAIADVARTRAVCTEAARSHVAWKTGTSSGRRDAWCAAVTARRTVVVWMGNPGGEGSPELVGQETAAPLALRLIAALDPVDDPWPVAPEDPTLAAGPHAGGARDLILVHPTNGEQFVLTPDAPRQRQRILLEAARRGDGHSRLWWFVDGKPIDARADMERVWWDPVRGSHEIRVIDDDGHGATARIGVRSRGG